MKDYNDRLRTMAEARYERIKRMRERTPPLSLREIAELEGCSKQRISEILKRGETDKAAA